MKKKAFTLLELSLVILIISILVVGSMSASISTINKAKYKTTHERLDAIYKAMGNYLITNKALPCPAIITVLDTDALYGLEGATAGICIGSLTGSGNAVYGLVPIQSLGLPAEMARDGFGTKFTYVINKNFTDLTNTVFVGTDASDIDITQLVSGGSQPITTEAVFVIISHGQNKLGGYNSNSATANTASSDASELENSAIATNDDFVAKSINSEDFDDVLFYKTRNQIIIDFDALELIQCDGATDGDIVDASCDTGTCSWANAKYNQIAISTTSCATGYLTTVAKGTRRCGAFGVWDTGFVNACTN